MDKLSYYIFSLLVISVFANKISKQSSAVGSSDCCLGLHVDAVAERVKKVIISQSKLTYKERPFLPTLQENIYDLISLKVYMFYVIESYFRYFSLIILYSNEFWQKQYKMWLIIINNYKSHAKI